MSIPGFIMALFMVCNLLTAARGDKNMVPNGSFEKSEKEKKSIPAKWQQPDGLASFWVKDSLRKGKCLKIDTDVYKNEYLARQKEMEKKPVPPAKPKTITKGNKYNTIAGVDGVAFYSEWITVKKGQYYRLEIESRTLGKKKTPKVFVKGYFEDPRRPKKYRRRVMYKKYLNCPAVEKKWSKHSMVFCPTIRSDKIKWVRIMIFAYWPPGIYFFDNVKLLPVKQPVGKTASSPAGK